MNSNKLTILGCSSALPTSERFSTAQVLQMLGRYFLIDCGEGTQIQLRKAKTPFSKINNIFISHLHGDHYFGIFGLLSTLNMLGRKHPLHLYGPPALQNIIEDQTKHLDEQLDFQTVFHVTDPSNGLELIFEDKRLEVFSFPLKHRTRTTGFLFKEKPKKKNINKEAIDRYQLSIREIVALKDGADLERNGETIPNNRITHSPTEPKSFAFCSDTAYSGNTAKYTNDVTLLYHEATFLDDMAKRAKQTLHSTARQAAQVAKDSNAKKLVLGHFSARYNNLSGFIEEAKPIFENTFLGQDLEEYEF